MHRADHVVEVAGLEQLRRAVLDARHEVGLDAEPQVGLLAHERAVLVDVIDGVALPERVVPQLERLAEAVDVFGDAQLGDALLGGGVAVALGVGGRVEPLGGRVLVVGAQVEVVVGQHRMIAGRAMRIVEPAADAIQAGSVRP